MARALITGITGQDGSYLAEWLLEQGYDVHGLVRDPSKLDRSRIAHLCRDPDLFGRRLFLHQADLLDSASLSAALSAARPDEVYHLASQTHVGLSFEQPEATGQITAMGALRLLEVVRNLQPAPKFFHASSGEIFGQPSQAPQDETTPLAPISPYGCAKAFATQITTVYRNSFGLFAVNGILFNHESPRRGEDFVSRKICRGAAAIRLGLQRELVLGDLSGLRDWGHARDYVRGMWLALQHSVPEDFVFATGRLHAVREILEQAFTTVQLDWTQYVRYDSRFARPAEPRQLLGNAGKAKRLLNWEPLCTFEQLIKEMTEAELSALADQPRR